MSPRDANEWYSAGDRARESGDYAAARQAYAQAVAVDPRHANAVYRLGELALVDGDRAGAAQLFQRTLVINPEHASARKQLAKLASQKAKNAPPSVTQPRCAPAGDGLIGIVQSVRRASENYAIRQGTRPVLLFRVQVREPGGEPRGFVDASIRGSRIDGSLEPGDWVEFPSGWRPGGALSGVVNLTTCSSVGVVRRPFATAFTWVVVLFVIAWIAVIFVVVGTNLMSSR